MYLLNNSDLCKIKCLLKVALYMYIYYNIENKFLNVFQKQLYQWVLFIQNEIITLGYIKEWKSYAI